MYNNWHDDNISFYILNADISPFESKNFKNVSTCTRCLILQNELHVDEILFFFFQVSGALKHTYVLSNYTLYIYKWMK